MLGNAATCLTTSADMCDIKRRRTKAKRRCTRWRRRCCSHLRARRCSRANWYETLSSSDGPMMLNRSLQCVRVGDASDDVVEVNDSANDDDGVAASSDASSTTTTTTSSTTTTTSSTTTMTSSATTSSTTSSSAAPLAPGYGKQWSNGFNIDTLGASGIVVVPGKCERSIGFGFRCVLALTSAFVSQIARRSTATRRLVRLQMAARVDNKTDNSFAACGHRCTWARARWRGARR